MLKDQDLLRLAIDSDDAVSLCEMVSRRHGLELMLDQASKIRGQAGKLCPVCLTDAMDAEGFCRPCLEETK